MTGTPPPITPFIDLKTPYAALRERIDARMRAVLDHGQFILGPEVGELEERLADYTGSTHCVTCASGTEALLIALMAFISGRLDVLDIALAYALINFIGVIAALRFFEYGDLTAITKEAPAEISPESDPRA